MPPDLLAIAERAGRYTLFAIEALVLGLVLFLLRWQGIGAEQIGLPLQRWGQDLLLGCGAGLVWIGLVAASFYGVARAWGVPKTSYYQEGSVTFWILIALFGAFVEEFWRAFCLLALARIGHSTVFSVMLTSVAFAAAHMPKRAGGAVASGIFGLVAASLYLWRGNLVTPCSAHLIANLGMIYWARNARPAR